MSNYEFMQETVDKISASAEHEPGKWTIDSTCAYHTDWNVQHWREDLQKIWTGCTTEEVFSLSQAKQLQKAFLKLAGKKASVAQEAVIKIVGSTEKPVAISHNKKPWWRFW